MKKQPLELIDQLTIENLQLKAGNLRLQSELCLAMMAAKISELAVQYGRKDTELNKETLTWDVEGDA